MQHSVQHWLDIFAGGNGPSSREDVQSSRGS